ncbi:MAG: coproporphyrinogen dehydrogenase HemZ [Ruminococcus sp.]|nr:coproporphyrinogen dehydrogenase HemZ [Ruminococcus sp.]
MINNDFKMPIIMIGNSFKYETEATLKLFFNTARYSFSDNESDAVGDNYIITRVDGDKTVSVKICMNGTAEVSSVKLDGNCADKDIEYTLCRLIYELLVRMTGIDPPWGLLTGIRPVKKVVDLIRQGKSESEVYSALGEKYLVSPKKMKLAYDTAVNQLPILDRIDRKAVSLYVSIPFCPTRCSYCSFVSHSMDSAIKLMPDYIKALCRELEIIGKMVRETNTKIDTIYFGGGTPTSISADDLRAVMTAVQENFDLANVREYSVEAGRPDTITEEKLRVIKEMGAQRISVNPQTLNDEVLKVIGRKHSGADALKAFEMARKVGFDNINTDLIAGLPTETFDSFKNTLDKMTELSPESITVHTLTIKRSAALFEADKAQRSQPAAEMVDYSIEKLMSEGYLPYYMYRQKNTVDNLENVGYAKKGCESYYNIFIMDETQTILGAGCAASTKLVYPDNKIVRIHNYKFPYEYIRSFDKLMEKKGEAVECLKKISSIPQK